MNIGINARHLIENKLEGIGWYSFEVLRRLVLLRPQDNFYFFYDRKTKPLVESVNLKNVIVYPSARHPILFKFWFNNRLPYYFKKFNIDLFFSPDGFLSLNTSVRQIGVIHDINFEHYPEDLPKNVLRYYQKYMPLFAKKANKIITVSSFSKKDICNNYGLKEDKVHVIYNGGNEMYKPIPNKERKDFVSNNNSGRPYFIYVGSLHKRKNILRMLSAFKAFNSDKKTMDFIIIGEKMWENQMDLHELLENVKFLGRKSGHELAKWVASSCGLVYVSYFEGFGLPVLEGMMAGVPVITSNVTSMPEVGGDAVIYVDPFDEVSIARGMTTAFNEGENFVKLGLKQSGKFSWDKSVSELESVISNVLLHKE